MSTIFVVKSYCICVAFSPVNISDNKVEIDNVFNGDGARVGTAKQPPPTCLFILPYDTQLARLITMLLVYWMT